MTTVDNVDARTDATAATGGEGRPSCRWLVALKGFPGSGKSTLGRALGRGLGWPLIDKDDVKDLLDGHAPEAGALAYDIMFNVARRQLLQGLSVICDSPLTSGKGYAHAVSIAGETDALLAVVECRCSDEGLWRRRIEARQALGLPAHHKVDWASLQAHLRTAAAEASYPIVHPRLVVDTTEPVPLLCDHVICWLARQEARAGQSKAL